MKISHPSTWRIPTSLRDLFFWLLPSATALWVFTGPLAFSPVPWPDDSAFYRVAHDLFQWPPRYVILPQAPFEATYAQWNFQTMPLLSVLIGLGRPLGIDGSWALKLYPLFAFAATGFVLLRLTQSRSTVWGALALSFSPILLWASTLVRPESFVGWMGVLLLWELGGTKLPPRPWRIAGLLAAAAYAHFHAIHLLFLVIPGALAYGKEGLKLLFASGWRTVVCLLPWILSVLLHWDLFWTQMPLQWERLSIPNTWLHSPKNFIQALTHSMGSPEHWLFWMDYVPVILLGIVFGSLGILAREAFRKNRSPLLMGASGWVLGAVWLWHSKPEVWFIYFLHLSCLAWCMVILRERDLLGLPGFSRAVQAALILLTVIHMLTSLVHARWLGSDPTWSWSSYRSWIDCIDRKLTEHASSVGKLDDTYQLWAPSFPDILVELTPRHPKWNLTRTNDYHHRTSHALTHAEKVDAIVVTETISKDSLVLDGPWRPEEGPSSVWLEWKDYYLHQISPQLRPELKPNRWVCAQGRWRAFLLLK